MKQFIVLLAVFPLMMAFMLQFAAQQRTDYRMQLINNAVDNACEKAKTEGRFSDENVSGLRKTLADISDCSEERIEISVPENMKYRTGRYDDREMMQYRVAVPIDGIMAMPGMFGISAEENSMTYVLEDEISSEKIKPLK